MNYLLLLLLSVPASAAPLIKPQDIGPGIAGVVIASSVSISGATSTTISGLSGNVYGRIRIVADGSLAAASDATLTLLRFNADTTGYRSEGGYLYGGGSGAISAITNGLVLWRAYGTAANVVTINAYFHSAVVSSQTRPFQCDGGGSQVGTGSFTVHTGGAWTDTTSAMTSIVIAWGSAFTGNVYVYQD